MSMLTLGLSNRNKLKNLFGYKTRASAKRDAIVLYPKRFLDIKL